MRSVGQEVHSGGAREQNVNTLFFMLGWARCGFKKKAHRICYTKLVLLHPVRSTDQVVHSGAVGA
jgi:hypothetical protein